MVNVSAFEYRGTVLFCELLQITVEFDLLFKGQALQMKPHVCHSQTLSQKYRLMLNGVQVRSIT